MRLLEVDGPPQNGWPALRELMAWLVAQPTVEPSIVDALKRVMEYVRQLERDNADLETLHAITVEASTTLENELSLRYDAVTSFLASTSHELRTPLHTVIGHAELVLEELAEAGIERHDTDLGRIRDSALHLLVLINGILDLSKVESGRIELVPEEMDVTEIVQELWGELAPLARQNGNALTIQCVADARVTGDRVRIRQCLLNLIGNALKFTRDGSVSVAVTREQDIRGAWLTVTVTDTGIGMSEDQLSRVFRPYAQAHAHTAREFGGTGLGLALTKSLCDRMGADLQVESTVGKGSTFRVRLPPRPPES